MTRSQWWVAAALPGVLALSAGLVVTTTAHVTAVAAPAAPHVMVIIMENTAYNQAAGTPYIVGSPDAPYINNTLLTKYTSATNWFSVEHVSDYDYFDLISGADQKGVTKPINAKTSTFVDQLAAKGISWKAYLEGMPSTCYTGGATGNYVKGHNPFVQFKSIVNNPSQCKNDVPYSQMTSDLNVLPPLSPPSFVWVTPDECNDMHTKCAPTNNLVRQGDNWLSTNIPAIQLTSWYKSGGTIIVTWDESVVPDTSGAPGTTDSGGHVPTVVISAGNHSTFSNAGDHFGTLHGLENAYGVKCLVAACGTTHGDISGAFQATTGAITGTVTDSQTINNPISGATVSCPTCPTTTATTDGTGLYTFSAVPPGSYSLSFSATGYTSQNSIPVSVAKGSTTTQDAALALVGPGSITGTVTDSQTTNPLSGATVGCTCSGTAATADTSGKYTFSSVTQGSYTLNFSATGYTAQNGVPVSVTDGSTTTQNAALVPQPGTITGTVTDQTTTNPIPGATVSCPTCPTTTATTAPDGSYIFSSVPEGGYSLSFSANGYTSQNSVPVSVTPGGTTTQNAILQPTPPFIFSDGFESGFTPWTSVSGLAIESTPISPHSGVNAAQGSVTSSAADARKTLPFTYTSAYERVWFDLVSQSTQVFLLQANTATNSSIATVYINSKGILGLQAADGSRHDTAIAAVTTNTWHELELRFTVGTTGSADIWLDNMSTPVLSLSSINLHTTPVGVMQIGDASSHTWNGVFDDAAFDTASIP